MSASRVAAYLYVLITVSCSRITCSGVTSVEGKREITCDATYSEGTSRRVEIERWRDEEGFVDAIARDRGEPVLFADVGFRPGEEWPAMSKWTVPYISKQRSVMSNVYVREDASSFVYFDADDVENGTSSGTRVVETMSMKRFMRDLMTEGPPLMYFSGALSQWGDTFAADVPDTFCVSEGTCVEPQIWISEADVVTATHYDAAFNFFTQIRGRKRFDLWPPSAGSSLYVHSSLSPFARQSQIDFSIDGAVNATAFPQYETYAKHLRRTVVVDEGDTLYVPPYWFHRVTALSPLTVSVSMWTETTRTLDAKQDVDETPLPFETTWEAPDVDCAVMLFVRLVLSAYHAAFQDDHDPIRVLLSSRYAPVSRRTCGRGVSFLCRSSTKKTTACSSRQSNVMTRLHDAKSPLRDKFVRRSETIIRRFSRIESADVRNLYFANWLESIARFASQLGTFDGPMGALCSIAETNET